MPRQILITGGAGFIGAHLATELLAAGYRVRALDNLAAQVHGSHGTAHPQRPAYLPRDVELVVGDVRDHDAVRRALSGVDAVFHFAARVGVGQSMYEIAEYTSVNGVGTAVLLEALMTRPVEKLIVASSMSVYGEGLYHTPQGRVVGGAVRTHAQLAAGRWDAVSDRGEPLAPLPTPEGKTPSLASVYALSKYDQERLCLIAGKAYGFAATALRFFNVYGPHQALSNPYTGVLAIFAARLLNDRPPLVFEDGRQLRDFVSVHDVARACRLALDSAAAAGQVVNVGSGDAISIEAVARAMAEVTGKPRLPPVVTGKHRIGDIRHCFADITLARRLLGYEPRVSFTEGISELAAWLDGQVAHDRADLARAELDARGLTL